jgi:hypothetical protein
MWQPSWAARREISRFIADTTRQRLRSLEREPLRQGHGVGRGQSWFRSAAWALASYKSLQLLPPVTTPWLKRARSTVQRHLKAINLTQTSSVGEIRVVLLATRLAGKEAITVGSSGAALMWLHRAR